MRKIIPFTFGVLVGTLVATAWAHRASDSTTIAAQHGAVAEMDPLAMMANVRSLPVEHHDAF